MSLIKSCSSPDLTLKTSYAEGLSKSKVVEANENTRFEFNEDPGFWKDHNVQVIIRTRPLNSYEMSLQGHSTCVRQDSSQMITWTGHPESRFTFDIVADEHVSQEMLFKVAGVPMVENCMAGYNSCMFAYGQTGSGKTHTMLGDIEEGSRRHSVNCGMTPRVFEYLFSRIQKDKDARREEKLKFTCRCSFLEIYNEQILDLLDPSSTNLQIREDSKKGIHVENITEVEITSARDAIQQLIQGAANRKVAATNMNRASSRSHSVFTCIIESKWELQGVTHHRFARLNLVDLAGSERQKSSGAEGERLKEATNINKSLSTLGLVIMNLVNISNGKSLHVPYRDSKLTFLLQDSLGGNAKTIIIANISPSSCCSLETLSTLKFAQRAKFIKNHAIVNEDASGNVLALKLENQNLKKEISQLRVLLNGGIESHTFHALSTTILGSPGSVAWAGQHELSSPLISEKKVSHKKEYEVALVGAIQREKEKDTSLQALAAENQAAMQLVKEREDEVQCLKMRLKFREAAIKRLEGVASGKISVETHLLAEREEHVKEINVLRSQVDRNQQATRFAIENLKLHEEIRRLKSFCEDGERERMNEQILVLESQLLEALDWKLMHESHLSSVKKQKIGHRDDDLLNFNQDCGLPWQAMMNEENEILRLQNESEINSLRGKLELCMEEKENLERHVIDLEKELEELQQLKISVVNEVEEESAVIDLKAQSEIMTMVDAIAAASQREAEAHETAILLSKENKELRMKLKVLIEENSRLVHLYENAATDVQGTACDESKNPQSDDEILDVMDTQGTMCDESENRLGDNEIEDAIDTQRTMHDESEHSHGDDEIEDFIKSRIDKVSEEDLELKQEVERLESQLTEMHEENEKLFGLYEKAMEERDELKRMLSSNQCWNIEDKLEYIDDNLLDEACLYDVELKDELNECSVEEDTNLEEDQTINGMLNEACLFDVQLKDEFSQCSDEPVAVGQVEIVEEDTNLEEDQTINGMLNEACLFDVQLKDEFSQCSDEPVAVDQVEIVEMNAHDDENRVVKANPISREDYNNISESTMSIDLVNDAHELVENIIYMKHENVPVIEANPVSGEDLKTQVCCKDLSTMKKKLGDALQKLVNIAEMVSLLGSLEREIEGIDELNAKIGSSEGSILEKEKKFQHLKIVSSEFIERKQQANKKLSALKLSLSRFSSSLHYFEQREALAVSKLFVSTQHVKKTEEEITRLQCSKQEVMDALDKIRQSETKLENSIQNLKSKEEEENRKVESEKVLIAIDNIEKPAGEISKRNWQFKATALLNAEEEKVKLHTQIKLQEQQLDVLKNESESKIVELAKIETETKVLEVKLQKDASFTKEMKIKLQNIFEEKTMLMEVQQDGNSEIEKMIIELYECCFEAEMKDEEKRLMDEELKNDTIQMQDLYLAKDEAMKRKKELVEAFWRCDENKCVFSDKVEADLSIVRLLLQELNTLI